MANYKERWDDHSNVFHDRITPELGRDVRDIQGLWGVSTALLLIPGDGYKGDSLRLFVLNRVLHTLLYIYYTLQLFKRIRKKETSDKKIEVKDQEYSSWNY